MLPRWLRARNEIELEFYMLIDKWQEDTKFYSDIYSKVVRNKEFQRVMKLGKDYPNLIVPLLLNEIQREPSHLFLMLDGITGDDPMTQDSVGNIKYICYDWINWGKKWGYI